MSGQKQSLTIEDPFEEIIDLLEDYEKDTPAVVGKHAYELCRCGVRHGDERDHDPAHNYHLKPISEKDLDKSHQEPKIGSKRDKGETMEKEKDVHDYESEFDDEDNDGEEE